MKKTNKSLKQKDESYEFDPLLTLQQDLNKTMTHFYDLFEPANFNYDNFSDCKISPVMDLIESNEYFFIEAEVPGIDEKDLKVTVDDNTLLIFGDKLKIESKHDRFLDREIRYGSYERKISLPRTADWENVSAKYENGILKVKIPKVHACKSTPKAVKIEHSKKRK